MAQGGFHQRRHGRAIRLLEGGRVAERVGKNVDTDGVVFSEKPIPVGSVFQVRLEDKVMTGVGTLVGWNICVAVLGVGVINHALSPPTGHWVYLSPSRNLYSSVSRLWRSWGSGEHVEELLGGG